MDLITISKTEMINIDLIESIEVKTFRGKKMFKITIGGKQYTPDVESSELLGLLLKKGVVKSTNQFFSV